MRILPCRHAYHTKCIDVWLTKNRRVCPVCKRKVYAIGERRRQQRRRRSADSTTDSMSSFDPDDTTPLINPQENTNSVNHGTFNDQEDDAPLEASSGGQENSDDDDEILDVQQQQPPTLRANQRFNPFNRVPNLPPTLADELQLAVRVDEPEISIWTRLKRYLKNFKIKSHQKCNTLSFTLERSHSQTIKQTTMHHYLIIIMLQLL